MRARLQFASSRSNLSLLLLLAGLSIAAVFIGPVTVRADDAPTDAVGRIEGRDVSVEPEAVAGGVATAAPSNISNGSVVTVHSGKARVTFFKGGTIEICGPARLTLLLSGQAITLALNFGRVRAELPATTTLRIFTPTIVGTPIDIGGRSRDVTVGLALDDSLCVLATSGAIQLEHQFTGEKIIVPEAGEFFLNPSQLLPIAVTPGRCQCLSDEPSASPTPVNAEFATLVPVPAEPVKSEAESPVGIAYSVLRNANQAHPLVASERNLPPVLSPSYVTSEAAVVPVLVFTADSPLPPPGPSVETMLLVRDARLSPEWDFSGRVDPPNFATAMQDALGEKPLSTSPPGPTEPSPQPKKRKSGFWAALKRAFGGGG
ncbi:MAG TPA: hypothetical protein VEJ45_08850 [Candidatus Acidoferrales bacterium]|nr:hypothetical protein [Candidatus Acidoferrales bacterium]